MLNGNTLKIIFVTIIFTLCLILIGLTCMVVFKAFPVDQYKSVLEVLGIPTLIGMIVQSFIHSNQQDTKEVKNVG